MELTIYKQDGTLRATISPSDNSTHQKGIMADNVLSLSFSIYEFIPLEVNDYVDFEGERFTLLERYRPTTVSTVEYQYDVMFYGVESEAKKALMLKMVDGENDTEFALTDTPRVHLQLVVDNINRIKGTMDWTVGEVLTAGIQVVTYDSTSCYDALNKIAEAFGTEWWIEGTTINLSRCEHGEPVTLGYGQGLKNLSKQSNDKAPFFTRLYPIGSTRNIDPTRYDAPRLRLPDGAMYVERNTQLGIVEHAEHDAFSDIYPRRVGYVGEVRVETRTIEGVERDIYFFTDRDGIPFDPNDYEIAGLVKNMEFEGGELNGQNFEVNFNSTTKEFEIINQYPYENQQLPGGSMIPNTGDPYVLWNIRMPDEYYPLAEQELLDATNAYLDEYSIDVAIYKGSTDYIEIERMGVTLSLGRRVNLISTHYFDEGSRISRITKFTRRVNYPTMYDIECSYAVAPGRMTAIESGLSDIQAAFREQLSNELQVLKSWDSSDPTEYNVFSARRSRLEHLSRQYPDVAKGFLQLLGGASFGDFAGGPTGIGGRVDNAGNGELESLVLRRFLEVPELRYNRVDVTAGDRWRAPGGGLIESVDTVNQIITLKLEEGEIGNIIQNDLCMGIFHSLEPADNSADDYDDGKGNRRFAGFYTTYFKVTGLVDGAAERKQFTYELRPVSSNYPVQHHPSEGMTFVSYGNTTFADRRTSVYETRTYQRYLTGVDDWEFRSDNIAAQFGDLSNLSVHGLNMAGYSAYLNNIYTTGVINQISQDGESVAPIPFNKGSWVAGHYAYYDYVTYDGSLWLCTNLEGTDDEPSEESPDWQQWVSHGRDADVSAAGRWDSTKVPYLRNSIVTLGRASFIARRDTSAPPVGLLKSGGGYLKSGSGYIMRGPVDLFVNTEDWMLLSPPPVDGQKGLEGMIVRITEWAMGVTYHNDETVTEGARYLDVVVISSGTSQVAYQCVRTHISSADTAPGNTAYWQPFNTMAPIYTPLLLAENAVIKFFQGQEIVVQDADGNVVGGLSGKSVDGTIWPLWAGLNGPASAPFRVDQNGKMFASNADIVGNIEATSGTFSGYVRYPFVTLEDSDAQYNQFSSSNWNAGWLLKNNVYIKSTSGNDRTVTLPDTADYIGTMVVISVDPSYSSVSESITVMPTPRSLVAPLFSVGILTPNAFKIGVNGSGYSSITIRSETLQFLGIPNSSGSGCNWLCLSTLHDKANIDATIFGNAPKIVMKGLPTSNVGLDAGDLWIDSDGFLKVYF